ncbi:aminotransferase class I/II-fold pyridoxal phosphate-dependent enzyme [bacterium]|nr:aminotransferase class I/II-fold pyridoxal phosphate-dependent enzyme [bacterium]
MIILHSTEMPFSLLQPPPYPFKELIRKKYSLQKKGKKILDLSTGICSIGAPAIAVDTLRRETLLPERHHYSAYNGLLEVRNTISSWFSERFSVNLNAESEITLLSGSKEGLSKIGRVVVRPQKWAIICDPSYPVYKESVLQAGGMVYTLSLRKQNNFLPDFSEVPSNILENCDAIFLNFPHNPTGTTLTIDFIKSLEVLSEIYDFRIVHDMAYSEIYRTTPSLSLLSSEKLRDRTVEFHSFSKNYGMTGFRIGFAAGKSDIIQALVDTKARLGSSVFEPIQYAIQAILLSEEDEAETYRLHCNHNRKIWENACDSARIEYEPHQAGYFLWATIPEKYESSEEYADFLLEELGILAVPGSFLGKESSHYIRFSIAGPTDTIEAAAQKIEKKGRQ